MIVCVCGGVSFHCISDPPSLISLLLFSLYLQSSMLGYY